MVKFGPSGNCASFYEAGYKSSVDAPKWLNEKGLTAYEYPFTKGILLGDDTARKIGDEAKKYNIIISAHAPYYINLANESDELVVKSYDYIINSLKKLKVLGGTNLVVHPGACMKLERSKAVELAKSRLVKLKSLIIQENLQDMKVCIETMGKLGQIGSYEEVVDFCMISDFYYPTFDFGHINSLTQGSLKTYEDYANVLNYAISKLGYDKVKNCHIHFSKIQYGPKGEVKHLTLDDEIYGPEFEPLAKVIKDLGLEPIIICESCEYQALDAIKLKNIYENV